MKKLIYIVFLLTCLQLVNNSYSETYINLSTPPTDTSSFITAESDTLHTTTSRGASTTNVIDVGSIYSDTVTASTVTANNVQIAQSFFTPMMWSCSDTAGTEDTALITLTDTRTGTTANEASEASLKINATATYGLYLQDGIAQFDDYIFAKASVYTKADNQGIVMGGADDAALVWRENVAGNDLLSLWILNGAGNTSAFVIHSFAEKPINSTDFDGWTNPTIALLGSNGGDQFDYSGAIIGQRGQSVAATNYFDFLAATGTLDGGLDGTTTEIKPIFRMGASGTATTGHSISVGSLLLEAALEVDGAAWFDGGATGTQFTSTIATGTSPYTCTSTTLNTNLNADLLDGQHGAYYQTAITGTDTHVMFFDGANNPAGDAGFTYNKTTDSATLVGTLQAEQVTSTDDITMAGLLTDTAGAADGTVANFDGTTNDYTTAVDAIAYKFSRDFAVPDGAGSYSMTGYQEAFTNSHACTATSAGNRSFSTVGLNGTLSVTGAHSADFTGPTANFVEINYGYKYALTRSGTITGRATESYSFINYGMRGSLTENMSYNDASGFIGIVDYGGYFDIVNGGTQIAGTLTRTSIGLYSTVSGSAAGASTAYGIVVGSVSGADTNWGFYNGSAAAHNFLGVDNLKNYRGTGFDAYDYYDGSDWIFMPDVVGTGRFVVDTGTAIGQEAVMIKQDDADQAFLNWQGTSAADQANNISTVNGDGVVDGPKNKIAAAGWTYAGMVKVEVNGTAKWMPVYDAQP